MESMDFRHIGFDATHYFQALSKWLVVFILDERNQDELNVWEIELHRSHPDVLLIDEWRVVVPSSCHTTSM